MEKCFIFFFILSLGRRRRRRRRKRKRRKERELIFICDGSCPVTSAHLASSSGISPSSSHFFSSRPLFLLLFFLPLFYFSSLFPAPSARHFPPNNVTQTADISAENSELATLETPAPAQPPVTTGAISKNQTGVETPNCDQNRHQFVNNTRLIIPFLAIFFFLVGQTRPCQHNCSHYRHLPSLVTGYTPPPPPPPPPLPPIIIISYFHFLLVKSHPSPLCFVSNKQTSNKHTATK